jgi:Domain of unknown function (DUF4145)
MSGGFDASAAFGATSTTKARSVQGCGHSTRQPNLAATTSRPGTKFSVAFRWAPNTAAVMMCRKLLFHVAVAHGLAEKDGSGRAPNFAEALQHLEDEGIFTKHMRPWIVKIKDVGNEANHEIPTTTSEQAMDVALFTRQLIRLAYELPAMVAEHAPADDGET